MKVSANLYNNYLYVPSYRELSVFLRNFTNLLVQTEQGWTHNSYITVPKATVKDAVYYDEIATKTLSFDTEQALLTSLKLGINQKNGAIINASQGFKLNASLYMTGNKSGYQANHIPVLFASFPSTSSKKTIVTGFVGEYDFRTNIFDGMIQFMDYNEVWKD